MIFSDLTNLGFYAILNFKMGNASLQPKFIKPFSKGQITLPKDYREYLGIDENSWLRIALENSQILIEPVEKETESRTIRPSVDRKTYLKNLLKVKGAWFGKKEVKEMKKIRAEIEKRLLRNEKDLA